MSALDAVKQKAARAGLSEPICGNCCHFEAPPSGFDMGRCRLKQDQQFRFGICLSWSNEPVADRKIPKPGELEDGTKVLFAGAESPLEARAASAMEEALACAEPGCDGRLELRFSAKLNRRFYGCTRWPRCDGVLPANDDGTPRGRPRTRALQAARNRAHGVFDRIWKDGHAKRRDAYAWLAEVMGMDRMDAHMFQMDQEQCERVIAMVDQKGPGTDYWAPWVERRSEHKREKNRRRARERRERKKRAASGG